MSRSSRLLDLIQLLRTYRQPVSGRRLSEQLGVSIRTLYRDIATLQAQGADIRGEPGFGYVLNPGFLLPPIMLSEEEIEALVLGSRWVAQRTDTGLGKAARNALAKIAAVLPDDLRRELETTSLFVGSGRPLATIIDLSAIREAIRRNETLDIDYADEKGRPSTRRIWPFSLGYFDDVRIIIAWCELRNDFRHFRADRISAVRFTGQRAARSRRNLLAAWKKANGIRSDL